MASVQQELLAVENTLKKCAQELGRLNVDNNRLQQFNEELSMDIQRLQGKVAKKTHTIDQEEKDKQIIHHKLVRAEKTKEELEIQFEKIQARKEQEHLRDHYEAERKTTAHKQKSQHQPVRQPPVQVPNVHRQSKDTPQAPAEQPVQPKRQEQVVKAESVSQAKGTPSIKVQAKVQGKKGGESGVYENTQKGQYEPPALFLDDNDSDSDSDEDNSKVLESLKQKLKQDKQELDQEDD